MNDTVTINPSRSQPATLASNKVIRNTCMLLSMTLLYSALTAGA